MTDTIAILSNAQFLGAKYTAATGDYLFSVTLTAGFTKVSPIGTDVEAILPWLWSPISQFQLGIIPNTNATNTDIHVIGGGQVTLVRPTTAPINNTIKAQLLSHVKTLHGTQSEIKRNCCIADPTSESVGTNHESAVPAFVQGLAQSAYPFPQNLNLSFMIKVDKRVFEAELCGQQNPTQADVDSALARARFIAAPEIAGITLNGASYTYTPGPNTSIFNLAVDWDSATAPWGDTASQQAVLVFAATCARPKPDANSLLDLETGWVKVDPIAINAPAWRTEEPFATLDAALANAGDFVATLNQLASDKTLATDTTFIGWFEKAAIRALRSIADGGCFSHGGEPVTAEAWASTPLGRLIMDARDATTWQDILGGINDVPNDFCKPIAKHCLDLSDNAVETWRAAVSSLLGSSELITTNASLPLTQITREMADIAQHLRNRDRLATVMSAIWRTTTINSAENQALIEKIINGSTLERINLLSLQADIRTAALKDATLALLRNNDPANLPDAFAQIVWDEFKRRLSSSQVLPSAVEPLVRERARLIAERDILPSYPASRAHYHSSFGDDRPRGEAAPITLTLDRPKAMAGNNSGDVHDLEQQTSGFGILIRQLKKSAPSQNELIPHDSDFSDWRCLNMAKVSVKTGPTTTELYVKEAPFPLRNGYDNGRYDNFFSYDESPAVAQVLYQNAKMADVEAVAIGSKTYQKLMELSEVDQDPAGRARGWAILPTLKFGQVYQFARFTFGEGGGLPIELADQQHPAQIKDQPSGVMVPANVVTSVRYLRTTRIGPPSLDSNSNTSLTTSNVKGVFAIADEVPRPTRIAGLTVDQPTTTYFRDDRGLGALPLPQKPAGKINWSGVRINLGHIILKDGGQLTFIVRNTRNAIASVKISRSASTVTAISNGATARLLLSDPYTIFNVEIKNNDGEAISADQFRLSVEESGRAFDIPQNATTTIVNAPGPALGDLNTCWIEVTYSGTTSVSFNRPYVEIDQRPIVNGTPSSQPVWVLTDNKFSTREALTERSFHFGKPTVEPGTFFRWIQMDEFLGTGTLGCAHRAANIEYAYEDRQAAIAKEGTKDPLPAMEDPAVMNTAMLMLVPIYAPGIKAPTPVFVPYPLTKAEASSAGLEIDTPVNDTAVLDVSKVFDELKRKPIKVKCTTSSDLAPKITPTFTTPNAYEPISVTVTVPEGQVWELRVLSLAQADLFAKIDNGNQLVSAARFPAAVVEGRPMVDAPTFTYAHGTFTERPNRVAAFAFAGHEVILEAATNKLPDVHALFNHFAVRENAAGIEAELLTAGGPAATDANLVYSKTAEVFRQRLRWQGRPPYGGTLEGSGFDYSWSDLDMHPPALAWEAAQAFERDGDDHIATPIMFDWTKRTQSLLSLAHPIDDFGASLFRFALNVESRYAPLIDWGKSSALRGLALNSTLLQTPVPTLQQRFTLPAALMTPVPWRRVFVRARITRPLPKPALRLVVPHTRAASAGTSTSAADTGVAPLRAYFDHEVFGVGGLGEHLVCEIVGFDKEGFIASFSSKAKFTAPYNQAKSLQEMGPDPILWPDSFSTGKTVQPYQNEQDMFRYYQEKYVDAAKVELKFAVTGPFGHTFDTGTLARKFPHASYVLTPELTVNDGAKLPWAFARVRFKLKVDKAAVRDASNHLESQWSDPVWVQILPDFDNYTFAAAMFSTVDGRKRLKAGGDLGKGSLSKSRPAFLVAGNDVFLTFKHEDYKDQEALPLPHKGDAKSSMAYQLWYHITSPVVPALQVGRRQEERIIGIYTTDPATGALVDLLSNTDDGLTVLKDEIGSGAALIVRAFEVSHKAGQPLAKTIDLLMPENEAHIYREQYSPGDLEKVGEELWTREKTRAMVTRWSDPSHPSTP